MKSSNSLNSLFGIHGRTVYFNGWSGVVRDVMECENGVKWIEVEHLNNETRYYTANELSLSANYRVKG